MRETSFIKQNKEKWKKYEQVLDQENPDPDELNDLFIQVTDDLSYSRTFYPNRSVRVYLNNIAQQIFYSIYKNKKTKLGRLAYFWTHDLPHMVYKSKQEFRLAFWVFIVSFAIGMVSCAMDSEFVRVVLSDDYVDMTLENIETGDPMAVYKQKGEFGMSLGITINNLWVAFQTFALGVFFAIGTFFFLIKNAVMVGAFQYFFYEQGVFQESFLPKPCSRSVRPTGDSAANRRPSSFQSRVILAKRSLGLSSRRDPSQRCRVPDAQTTWLLIHISLETETVPRRQSRVATKMLPSCANGT